VDLYKKTNENNHTNETIKEIISVNSSEQILLVCQPKAYDREVSIYFLGVKLHLNVRLSLCPIVRLFVVFDRCFLTFFDLIYQDVWVNIRRWQRNC